MAILLKQDSKDEGQVAGTSEDENRAVRLTWLFHLLGDLHQPMHSIALVDAKRFPVPPHGDQGGNKLAIREDADVKPKNLHWFWDGMFSNNSQFDQVRQQAERLTHDPELLPAKLRELDKPKTVREWAAESYANAKKYAYQDGKLTIILMDDVNANRIAASEIPIVNPELLKQSRLVAERRIAVAGHRLAAALKEIAQKSTVNASR